MISTFAIEPDVPRDPLAAAESAEWASARRLAILGLPVDARTQGLLQALAELDELVDGLERDAATEVTPVALTDAAEEAAIELSPDEVSDAETEADVVEAFVQLGASDPSRLASADTIVLSGPDIKRKIRHKQSVMPSYVAQVLYEDILALFEINDREGALVSLERLLTYAPISPQIEAFLSHNESRLLDYYQNVLGPWERVARLKEGDSSMPEAYFHMDKVAAVVRQMDGQRTLSEVIARSGLRTIEACAVLSQLARSANLDLADKPAAA